MRPPRPTPAAGSPASTSVTRPSASVASTCCPRTTPNRPSPTSRSPIYIGRISVTDDDLAPLVIDWRAPVAEPFYRATAVEPMGVARRRHFQTHGRRLIGLDDEVFDAEAAEASGFTVVGEGALLAALDQERTGRMRDIVATIQAEQDEAIRAPISPGSSSSRGGPGTGKTAVALHRAAYLLYTHRKRLASQGVLMVGPSAIFLRYIDEVLPSLGEDEVSLATPAALKPRLRCAATSPRPRAAVKGDVRMAKVIAAAIGDRERPMPRDVVVSLDGYVLRMRRRDSPRIMERAHARRARTTSAVPSWWGSCSTTSSGSTGARSSARTAPIAPVSTPRCSSSSSPPTGRRPRSPIPPSRRARSGSVRAHEHTPCRA